MAQSPNAVNKLDEKVTCLVCSKQYQDPKLLPCQHIFCSHRLESTRDDELENEAVGLKCPSCGQQVCLPGRGVVSFPSASTVSDLREVHKLMLATREVLLCTQHSRPLEVYCLSCQELVCLVCIYRDHRTHEHSLAADFFEQFQEQIKQEYQPVREKAVVVNNALALLEAREADIRAQGELIREQIHLHFEKMLVALQHSREQLTQEVDIAVEEKITSLSIQKEEFEGANLKLANCQEFLEKSLFSQSQQQTQTLLTKEQLLKCIQEVCSQVEVGALPIPVVDADLQFVGNNQLIELCKGFAGMVRYSPLHQKFSVVEKDRYILGDLGEESTLCLSVCQADGSPFALPRSLISVQMESSDGSSVAELALTDVSHGNCKVVFTPLSCGPHQVRVMVSGCDITGSPFTVLVSPTPSDQDRISSCKHIVQHLREPYGVAVGRNGSIVVSESSVCCVTVLTKDGMRERSFGCEGCGEGQFFDEVCGVALTADERVIVADRDNHRIQLFSLEGQTLAVINNSSSNVLFSGPRGLAVHDNGQIFVANAEGNFITVLNSDLVFSHSFGTSGSRPGEFYTPRDVAIDRHGMLYVVDLGNHRVQKMFSSGQFVSEFGGFGSCEGQLNRPTGIAVDNSDNVYVSDSSNSRISVFTTCGWFVKSIRGEDYGSQPFRQLRGLAVDKDCHVYACDSGNSQLVII